MSHSPPFFRLIMTGKRYLSFILIFHCYATIITVCFDAGTDLATEKTGQEPNALVLSISTLEHIYFAFKGSELEARFIVFWTSASVSSRE